MTDKLRLALVGCGAIARYHLDGIKEEAPQIEVTACIDPDMAKAQAFAAETGGRAFASLEEALQADADKAINIDAVDIMVPHDLHEELAKMTFAAGKHLLLEKPMATTLDGCQRILDAYAATQNEHPNLVFMVAENAQYWPEVVLAKELIDEGAIGDIITARAAFVLELDPQFFTGPGAWRYSTSQTGGGIAIDGGSHWIRPLRMWMGEIKEVTGAVDHPFAPMEGESMVRSLIRFESGKVAAFDALMTDTVMAPQPWWQITGTKGEIIIEDGLEKGGLLLYNAEHRDGYRVADPKGYGKSFGPELKDFAAAVLDGSTPAAGPEDSLGELRTILALYRSAESGKWEPVWE